MYMHYWLRIERLKLQASAGKCICIYPTDKDAFVHCLLKNKMPIALIMRVKFLCAETKAKKVCRIKSNFNGSNTFGTMKISSRQG